MKTVLVLLLVAIVAALGNAGLAMLQRGDDKRPADAPPSDRMARALAWRVGLSVTAFVLILLAWSQGWITPTGLPMK